MKWRSIRRWCGTGPFRELAKFWGRNRPASAAPWDGSYDRLLKGQVPEFGSVNFRKRKFSTPEHAVNYAVKYMLKQPEQGFPDWVLQSTRLIRMFETSHRLLPSNRKRAEKPPIVPQVQRTAGPRPADTCFCEKCRGEDAERPPEPPVQKRRTIGERVAACGSQACIVHVPEEMKEGGELVPSRPRFVALVAVGFQEALAFLGIEFVGQRKVRLRSYELEKLVRLRDPEGMVAEWTREQLLRMAA
jgi:hypothetical protein